MSKGPVIIDTSIWLLACAHQTTGDTMSGVDRQINEASASKNPKKYRGFLARMLVDYDVIVPTIVLNELRGIAAGGTLNRGDVGNLGKLIHQNNKADLKVIIDAMEGLTTDVLPTKEQVIRQEEIWERIRSMVGKEKEWKTKFSPHIHRVKAAAAGAKALKTTEPWLKTKQEWTFQLKELQRNPSTKISERIRELEFKLRREWPDIIPDYEILLVSEATNSPIASRDKDFQLMWEACPELLKNTKLKPFTITEIPDQKDEESSVHKLGQAIRKNVKPARPGPDMD